MLKSTYKPPPALAPLPEGWTEHKAPSGHTYYYHADAGKSTYTRPGAAAAAPTQPGNPLPYRAMPSLADPRVANALLAQLRGPTANGQKKDGDRPPQRPKPQPRDRPVSVVPIPGHEPWVLVYTKYGRRFAHNTARNASYWHIPERLKEPILELDKARIRAKAEKGSETSDAGKVDASGGEKKGPAGRDGKAKDGGDGGDERGYDSSEYEEVEVTDYEDEDEDEEGDDGGGGDGDEHAPKRRRTAARLRDPDRPVEFSEADIAFQLQAMGAVEGDYGDDAYGDGEGEHGGGVDGAEPDDDPPPPPPPPPPPLTDDDARLLFHDLLDDIGANPYSPWDRLVEEGRMVDDPRYAVLHTMRARREAWEAWSAAGIRVLKEQRAREEKKDPRIAYVAFLADKATPKLYWPEFKRKYRKEPPMRDAALADRDREKMYREHVGRLKMPAARLKADLTELLRAQPAAVLNGRSPASAVPPQVAADLRYISLDAETRDALVEAYIQTLPPPPPEGSGGGGEEERSGEREKRERAGRALEGRQRGVEQRRRDEDRRLEVERQRLRVEEMEVERAKLGVGKGGLRGQLEEMGRRMEMDKL